MKLSDGLSTFCFPILLASSAAVMAQTEIGKGFSISGNATIINDYRFRGYTQTNFQPAIQVGVDLTHTSGFYLGNWNSNVNSGAGFPEGNLEMDFYGGFKKSFGDFGVDVGGIYYYYPGTNLSGKTVKNGEVYLGASWKFISFKYYYALTDYFNAKGPNGEKTDGTSYYDLGFNYDLGSGWGVNAHVGYLDFKKVQNADYTDWKLGVTKDVGFGVVGLSYTDSNARACSDERLPYCWNGKDVGKTMGVLSFTKSF